MCDGCDREVTIGELMEFHAENYPEEDQSLREAVLRKMESEEGFDEADDTFLNEVLADYTQKVPMEAPKSKLTVEQKETMTIVQKALKDRGADKILYLTYLENKSTRNAFWFGFVYKDGGSTYGGMAFGAYGKMPSVKAESYSSPVFAVLEINTRKRNKIENRSYVPVTESTGRTFKSEDEDMEDDEEYEADEEDTVPEEELDVELPQKEEDELEAEVEEAEEDIDEDIEDYDAPDVKDYLKTFAVFAVAASGAIVGIFLTLKGIAAMSQIK